MSRWASYPAQHPRDFPRLHAGRYQEDPPLTAVVRPGCHVSHRLLDVASTPQEVVERGRQVVARQTKQDVDAGRLDIGVDNTHTLSSGRENRSQVRRRVGLSRATAKGVDGRNDWHLCMPSEAITCADRYSEWEPGRVTVRSRSSLVKGHAHSARQRERCATTRRARSDVARPSTSSAGRLCLSGGRLAPAGHPVVGGAPRHRQPTSQPSAERLCSRAWRLILSPTGFHVWWK